MAGVEVGDFGSPDETRAPDKTTIEVVRMGSANASRMRLEPGWRWSECVKPVVEASAARPTTSVCCSRARCTSSTMTEPSRKSARGRRT